MTSSSHAPEMAASTFRREAISALREIQDAIRDVLSPFGQAAGSPRELQRVLDLDYRLCWRASRIMSAADPLGIAPYVPSKSSIAKLVRAAVKQGANEAAAEATLDAEGRFREMVERHAEERVFFDTMTGALSSEATTPMDLELKRAAFRANSQIYGRYCKLRYTCSILAPAAKPGHFDFLYLHGARGYQQLRPEASMKIAIVRGIMNDREEDPMRGDAVGLDLGEGYGLLKQYSSPHLPPLRVEVTENQARALYLTTPDLGIGGELDFALGEFNRDCLVRSDTPGEPRRISLNSWSKIPAILMTKDLLIHRSLFGGENVDTKVLADFSPADTGASRMTPPELPIRESSTSLGMGIRGAHLPEFADYTAMLRDLFGQVGWDPDEFRVFRCKVEYPVLFSVLRMKFDLEENT